jgi:hypothetical protein
MDDFKPRYSKGLESCICGHYRYDHDHSWKILFGRGECSDCTCPRFVEKLVTCPDCKRDIHQKDSRNLYRFNKHEKVCKDKTTCNEIFMKRMSEDMPK